MLSHLVNSECEVYLKKKTRALARLDQGFRFTYSTWIRRLTVVRRSGRWNTGCPRNWIRQVLCNDYGGILNSLPSRPHVLKVR
jgi:hypothetical protein